MPEITILYETGSLPQANASRQVFLVVAIDLYGAGNDLQMCSSVGRGSQIFLLQRREMLLYDRSFVF